MEYTWRTTRPVHTLFPAHSVDVYLFGRGSAEIEPRKAVRCRDPHVSALLLQLCGLLSKFLSVSMFLWVLCATAASGLSSSPLSRAIRSEMESPVMPQKTMLPAYSGGTVSPLLLLMAMETCEVVSQPAVGPEGKRAFMMHVQRKATRVSLVEIHAFWFPRGEPEASWQNPGSAMRLRGSMSRGWSTR